MQTERARCIVEGADPFAIPYEIRDADISGLLLCMHANGVKSFYVDLTRGVHVRLGRYPVMTIKEARSQANAGTSELPPSKLKVTTFGGFIRDRYAPRYTVERKTGARNLAASEKQFGELCKKALADVTP